MHTVKKGIKAPSVPYSGLDRHSLRIKAGKEDTINTGLVATLRWAWQICSIFRELNYFSDRY